MTKTRKFHPQSAEDITLSIGARAQLIRFLEVVKAVSEVEFGQAAKIKFNAYAGFSRHMSSIYDGDIFPYEREDIIIEDADTLPQYAWDCSRRVVAEVCPADEADSNSFFSVVHIEPLSPNHIFFDNHYRQAEGREVNKDLFNRITLYAAAYGLLLDANIDTYEAELDRQDKHRKRPSLFSVLTK